MYKILFYETRDGFCEFSNYMLSLKAKSSTDKNSRIKLAKIVSYMNKLEKYGTYMGAPFTKYLSNDIWELRPLKDRVLYAYWEDNTFIILHHFEKKTKKTPRGELNKAKSNYQDFLSRAEVKND